ncbi:beta-lactamase family protein [Chryseobacterium suipulveris]|uniref:Beta-lactamase family protein n=1 Tax=Chryseobacterium suipulveris TaxID=2929800 RepID=A0ABY4BNR5_9FLAO|nr:serine hydrolase domain-containing protein [Chryseobacterium suipulveris]UOE39887.1 beta-lactamase family protein [Chryseobacterium suipulveris]
MKILKQLLLYASFTVLLLSACNRAEIPYENIQLANKIDLMADSILSTQKLPGMVVGVWAPQKRLTYLKGKGIADISTQSPVKPEFVFRAGSNTKTFTVTMILQLVDENKLKLEDKLSLFIPEFHNGDKITIRNLANMTSGIKEYTATPGFQSIFNSDPLHKWTSEEIIGLIKNEELQFTPGTKGYYSNSNTIILGAIVEKVTGKTITENYQSRILSPLRLRHTAFPGGPSMPFSYIHGYETDQDPNVYDFDVSTYFDPSYAGAAGAIISNAGNLKTWVENLVHGTLLSREIQAQRFTGLPIPDKHATTYGLGMLTFGDGYWGHTGELFGYSSIMMHNPTTGATIVIAYNYQNQDNLPDNFYRKIVKLLK